MLYFSGKFAYGSESTYVKSFRSATRIQTVTTSVIVQHSRYETDERILASTEHTFLGPQVKFFPFPTNHEKPGKTFPMG